MPQLHNFIRVHSCLFFLSGLINAFKTHLCPNTLWTLLLNTFKIVIELFKCACDIANMGKWNGFKYNFNHEYNQKNWINNTVVFWYNCECDNGTDRRSEINQILVGMVVCVFEVAGGWSGRLLVWILSKLFWSEFSCCPGAKYTACCVPRPTSFSLFVQTWWL